MISDEISHREMDRMATRDYEERFDPKTGAVLDSKGNILYFVDMNSDENGYVFRSKDSVNISESEDDDIVVKETRTRKEIYKDWDYTNG
jgi:hypothetical protein